MRAVFFALLAGLEAFATVCGIYDQWHYEMVALTAGATVFFSLFCIILAIDNRR